MSAMKRSVNMPDPTLNKLGAYLDGELGPRETAEVEAHLTACADCRAELADLRRLSSLLACASMPEFTPAQDFKANVMLQLPRRDESAAAGSNTPFSIWLIPLLVLAMLIFTQITMGLSSLIAWFNQTGLLNGSAGWAAQSPLQTLWFSTLQNSVGHVLDISGLTLLNDAGVFTWNVFVTLLMQIAAAALYWAVLALAWRKSTNPFRMN